MAVKKCWGIFHFDPKTVQTGGMAYTVLTKEERIGVFWLDENECIAHAHEMSARHPGHPIVILEAKYIFEAKIPDTVLKSWKDNGELLPVDRPQKTKKARMEDPIERVLRGDRPAPRPAREQVEVRVNPIGGLHFFDQPMEGFEGAQAEGQAGGPVPNPDEQQR